MCIDSLYFSNNKLGNTNTKFNLNSLNISDEPNIQSFSSNIIIEKIKKRREDKLKQYQKVLEHCQKQIIQTDENLKTDMIFECDIPDSHECLKYIELKLRNENFDTIILSKSSIFITWKYIELKLEQQNKI